MRGQRFWQLEDLETRQLLSASVGAGMPIDSGAVLEQPLTRTPSIVGTYNGSTTQRGLRGTQALSITVTSQSRRGALAGTVVSGGPGTFTGTIGGDSFTLTVHQSGSTTTVTGTVSGKTLSGTWVSGRKSGTFTASKS